MGRFFPGAIFAKEKKEQEQARLGVLIVLFFPLLNFLFSFLDFGVQKDCERVSNARVLLRGMGVLSFFCFCRKKACLENIVPFLLILNH